MKLSRTQPPFASQPAALIQKPRTDLWPQNSASYPPSGTVQSQAAPPLPTYQHTLGRPCTCSLDYMNVQSPFGLYLPNSCQS